MHTLIIVKVNPKSVYRLATDNFFLLFFPVTIPYFPHFDFWVHFYLTRDLSTWSFLDFFPSPFSFEPTISKLDPESGLFHPEFEKDGRTGSRKEDIRSGYTFRLQKVCLSHTLNGKRQSGSPVGSKLFTRYPPLFHLLILGFALSYNFYIIFHNSQIFHPLAFQARKKEALSSNEKLVCIQPSNL